MKAKLVLFIGILLLTLVLGAGCANRSEAVSRVTAEPDFTALSSAPLSQLTDQEIEAFIDHYYERMQNQIFADLKAYFAQIIEVYQNELLLRQKSGGETVPAEIQSFPFPIFEGQIRRE